jgi:UDP-glucose 4-epimerase
MELVFTKTTNDYGMEKYTCEHGIYTLSYVKHPMGYFRYFVGNANQTLGSAGIAKNKEEVKHRLEKTLELFLGFEKP